MPKRESLIQGRSITRFFQLPLSFQDRFSHNFKVLQKCLPVLTDDLHKAFQTMFGVLN